MKTLLTAALVALVSGATGCWQARSPILNPDARTPQEYAADQDACIQKHTFAVTDQPSGQCLHCELFMWCMTNKFWDMGMQLPANLPVPCCRGTTPGT